MKKIKCYASAKTKSLRTSIGRAVFGDAGFQPQAETSLTTVSLNREMKKIKCYGKAKTRALCTSIERAVFGDAGFQPQAATSLMTNRPLDLETSDTVLFTSFKETKPILKERKTKIGKARRRKLKSNLSNSELSKSVGLADASTQTSPSQNKPYALRPRCPKIMSKKEKSLQQLNASNMSSPKVLKYKKNDFRNAFQRVTRKKRGKYEVNPRSGAKVPRFSSIIKYPLNVEKLGNSFKRIYHASAKTYSFEKSVRNSLTRLDKELRVNLSRLDKEVRVNLTRLNLADYSFIPNAENSFKSDVLNADVTSVQKCDIVNESNSFTPIKIHQGGFKDGQLHNDPHRKTPNFITSTPVTLRKTEINIFPNVSGINTPTKKSKYQTVVQAYFDNAIRISQSTIPATNPSIYDDMSLSKLSPVQVLNKTVVKHPPNLVNSSPHQSSRSCELYSKFEKSDSLRRSSFPNETNYSIDNKTIGCYLSTLLQISEQDTVIAFQDIYDWSKTAIRKIGEGTYGEVFMVTNNGKSSVIKVIPFRDNNDNPNMQTIESVFSEIKVSMCLSELRKNAENQTKNFNQLKSVKIVKGCYPIKMMTAWDIFMDTKTCYNVRPDFGDQQMFAILELDFGGKDMGVFVMRSATEAQSILKQIAISLAIAEEAVLFEHRDLHLGNILVQRNKSKSISYVLQGKRFKLNNGGLVVSIIDFTLSRVLDSGCVFYNDIADDEDLFNQTGDYQFKVYKQTREGLNNDWKTSLLFSNVLWLQYLCVKFLEYEYSRKPSKKDLESLDFIKKVFDNLKDCESAMDVIKNLKMIDFVPDSSQKGSLQSKTFKYFDRKSNSCVRL